MDNIFEKALNNIKKAKTIREAGGVNNIPFGLPNLDRIVPGVMKGLQYIVCANSSVGKTQLTKFLFVNQVYKFIKENPQLGIKLKILYFALEESKEEFMKSLISNRLKEQYDITVDSRMLSGINHTLSDAILEKIESCREYFSELEKSIDIIDSVSNPFGIYKYIRGYATDNGTHHYKSHVFKQTLENGRIEEKTEQIYDRYEPNDPNEIVIDIVDHVSLLAAENGGTLHEAMGDMSAKYGRKMITKHFGHCLVLVQQLAAATEKLQFTNSGQSIEAKLEPSLESLGDNKLTARDALIVLGLFAPERYQIEKHLGYDIRTLKDNYRCISVLKNRFGLSNYKFPVLFNGATNLFSELPKLETPELRRIYEDVRNSRNNV